MSVDIAGLRARVRSIAGRKRSTGPSALFSAVEDVKTLVALASDALDEIERLQAEVARLRDDITSLWPAAKIYLDAIDNDPEHEYLTLPEAFLLTKVREAIERHSPDAEGATDA